MRKVISLLILVSFFGNNLFSVEYQRLVDSNNRWNYVYIAPTITCDSPVNGPKMTYSFYFSGDTTINNTAYLKLMIDVFVDKKPVTKYIGALREDTIKQLVYYRNYENVERLSYSFNHMVGDTLSIDSITYPDGYVVRRVKSIDAVTFNSKQRKRIEICDTLYKYSTPIELFSDYWFEGIGSFKILVDDIEAINKRLINDVPGQIYDRSQPLTLVCFSNNEEIIYHNSLYDSCIYIFSDLSNGIESSNSHDDIILYSNPASDLLRVSCNESIKKIDLLDINGKILRTTSTNELDVSMLADGLYFIRATTESTRMLIRRFIKRAK